MKEKEFLSKFVVIALLAAATLILANPASAQQTAGSDQNRPNPTGDGTAAAGFVSGVFSLMPGQSVRVAAVNTGEKAIPVEIVFVPISEQGKAGTSIQCNETPAPGDAMIEKYSIPDGTSNRTLMYVQIRFQNASDLKTIAPSLEVFDEQAIGPGGGRIFS
jgi:hypothetical protein